MERTDWVFLWEGPDGERCWEALSEKQVDSFLEKLVESGVNPASIMVSYFPIFFHWVWKKFHNGLSDVNFCRINEEISGTEQPAKSNHKPVDVPVRSIERKKRLGWISPDGRFFGCEFGGHTELARQIVGSLQEVADPEKHLEELGWAKIYSGVELGCSVGMGERQKLTNDQLKKLEEMTLDRAFGVEFFL